VSEIRSRLTERADELRLAFDRSFAEAVRHDIPQTEDLLAFRVGSEPYALRLSEVTGLFAARRITRLPGATAFLGIAGFRGSIVPAYDLQVLLGLRRIETPRWLAIASAAPVAFAFETFDGHLRVPRDTIMPEQAGEQLRRLTRDFASAGGPARPIVHLPSVLDAIRPLLTGANMKEEG
jgi:chemotaxis signal transduction protein